MLFFAGMERRVGKVSVTAMNTDWPKRLAAVQKDCIVLRCEYRPIDDSFHMDVLHPDLDPVEAHSMPPRYDVVLAKTDDGFVRTRFIRH